MAGITPIDEMIEATENGAPRAATVRAQLDLPITPATLASTLQAAFAAVRPFAASPADVASDFSGSGQRRRSTDGDRCSDPSRRRSSSAASGRDVADLVSSAFRASNFLPTTGSVSPAAEAAKPGRELAAWRCRRRQPGLGDLELGATGTVTHVDGERVYAFGHPFYNLGPTQFPMTRAYVHAVLPSLMSSIEAVRRLAKRSARSSRIARRRSRARSARCHRTLPITIALETGRGPSRTFSFRVVRRSVVHAAPHLRGDSQHAEVVRA